MFPAWVKDKQIVLIIMVINVYSYFKVCHLFLITIIIIVRSQHRVLLCHIAPAVSASITFYDIACSFLNLLMSIDSIRYCKLKMFIGNRWSCKWYRLGFKRSAFFRETFIYLSTTWKKESIVLDQDEEEVTEKSFMKTLLAVLAIDLHMTKFLSYLWFFYWSALHAVRNELILRSWVEKDKARIKDILEQLKKTPCLQI